MREGLTVDTYVERLVRADQEAFDELEALALEGLNFGEPIEIGPSYWDDKTFGGWTERLSRTGAK